MQSNSFNYKYSAPTEKERREIKSIRRQYIAENSEKGNLERLRQLHSSIKISAGVPALLLGSFGTLLFGGGLAFVLEFSQITLGIIISAAGVIPTALAYPLYRMILRSKKKKYSEEIIRLSDELLG